MNVEHKARNNFLYYCLLLYTIVFFTQIGGRISFLGAVRIELVLGAVIALIIIMSTNGGTSEVKGNRVNRGAILFLLSCFISIPFAYNKTFAFEVFIRLLKFAAIYLFIIFGIKSEKQLKGFIWIYVLVVSFIFCESLCNAVQGLNIRLSSGAMRLFGPPGIFASPNGLGGLIASILPFLYYLSKYYKSWKTKLFLISLIIIAIRVIMYTNSRTAFVGLLAFLVLIWLSSGKKLITTIAVVVCCILLWQFAPPETKDRFLTLSKAPQYMEGSDDGQDAMGNRIQLLRNAIKIFLKNPITGVGAGNYIVVSGYEYNMWLVSHNQYAQMLTEIGLIGSTCYIVFIFFIFKNLKEAKRIIHVKHLQVPFVSSIIRSVNVFLILRLVVGMFGDELYDNSWWIAGGLSVVILKLLKNNVNAQSGMEDTIKGTVQ